MQPSKQRRSSVQTQGKQERIRVINGSPSLNNMIEDVPEIHKIGNKGVYLCVKIGVTLYSIKMDKGIN